MGEEYLPLVEPGAVQTFSFVVSSVREDVSIVAFDIERQKREHVHALRSQIIDCTDNALAFAVLPSGIAGLPVLYMRRPGFDKLVLMARENLGDELDGKMDEVRVSNTERTAAWAGFEYHNMYESDNELTWDSQESGFTPTVTIITEEENETH